MSIRQFTPEEREILEVCEYTLLENDDAAYGLFLSRITLRCSDNPVMGSPAVIGMGADGNLLMVLCLSFLKEMGIGSVNSLREVIKHEVLHFIMGHVGSIGKLLKEKYGEDIEGLAADIVVNQYVILERLKSPKFEPVSHLKYGFPENLTTEEYCVLLQANAKSNPNIQEDLRSFSGDGESTDAAGGKEQNGKAKAISLEVVQNDKDSSIDSLDLQVVNTVEQIQRQDEVVSKARGFGAADVGSYVASLKRRHVVPWNSILRRKEGHHVCIKRVPSKLRPSRRNPQFYGRVRHKGLIVMFVIDTSGSMGKRELRCVEAEVRGIHQRGAKIILVFVDAGVAKIVPYTNHTSLERFFGGGGTDFRPAFDLIKTMTPRPDFLTYFTDGHGIAPTEQTIDTLWVLTDTGKKVADFKSSVCSWGDVAVVKTEAIV